MNVEVDCATTAQAEAAIAAGNVPVLTAPIYLSVTTNCKIVCKIGKPHVEARESSQPHVEAWGSSQPHVVARESSQPHVVARESSQPHVVARESSQPHVEAWESSQPHVEAWGSSQPHVEARESSQPHVVAWESSQPHVVARESSQPHVEAWGSSQPHVEAWGSSQPHVEASGICQLSIRGKMTVKAGKMVAIAIVGAALATIDGGGFVQRAPLASGAEWCEYYGVEVHGEYAVLFKGLSETFRAPNREFLYQPGESQVDPNWDPDPAIECGSGLHFSPSPRHTLEFNRGAKKFVGVLVKMSELLVHPNGQYPQKNRGPRTYGCWECDIDGNWIGELKPDFSKFDSPAPVTQAPVPRMPNRQSKAKKKPKAKKRGSR